MPDAPELFKYALVFSYMGLVLWLVFRYEKKRTAALEIVANELGLQFSPHKDERLLAKLQQFRLKTWMTINPKSAVICLGGPV